MCKNYIITTYLTIPIAMGQLGASAIPEKNLPGFQERPWLVDKVGWEGGVSWLLLSFGVENLQNNIPLVFVDLTSFTQAMLLYQLGLQCLSFNCLEGDLLKFIECMVQDDPKLLDDSGVVPIPEHNGCGLILGWETVSLLDGNQPGGQVPLVLQT